VTVAEQDRQPPLCRAELEALASVNASAANELASEAARLRTRIASLEAQLWRGPGKPDLHDRQMIENSGEVLRNLQHCRAELADAQARIAMLSQDNVNVRTQHAELAQHTAHLVEHNRELTEAATERARQLQDQAPRLTQAYVEIATLSEENRRLLAEHAVMFRRAAELEAHIELLTASAVEREVKLQAHNELLTKSAVEREVKLRDCESKLAQALEHITSVERDNTYVRVEHALQAQRAAELQDHNCLLTESATETARKLQERDAELTKALIEIATLAPENQRLQAEHAFYAQRAAELEEHNRLLTEAAIERATKLQHCEAKLTRVEGELAAVTSEYQHILAGRAGGSRRAPAVGGRALIGGTNDPTRNAKQADRPSNKS